MTEQLAQGDGVLRGHQFVLQISGNRRVKREPAILNEAKGSQGSDRLADGRSLEQRVEPDGPISAVFSNADASCPDDAVVNRHCYARARNALRS